MAVDHLVATGRRRIGMIANCNSPVDRRWREDGFRQALPSGVEPLIVREPANLEGGHAGLRRLLESAPDLDGIFAYNDIMAIGAMRELAALGKSVPGDVAVIGCDDIQMSAFVSPALTTIQINRERLGFEAVRNLIALRDGHDDGVGTVIPVQLICRDSA